MMPIEITRPLMTLVDEDGTPVPGVSKSASEVEAMEKASKLGPGHYILKRPDASIVVKPKKVVTQPQPAPVGHIPFGDVAKLQQMGLLPAYRYDIPAPSAADANIDWSGAGGERPEIGLMPEDHSAFVAGHTYLLPGILAAAQPTDWARVDHAHKPNLYWLPYLMTGDPKYIEYMEQVSISLEKYKNIWPTGRESIKWYFWVDRLFAWSIRDLAQLAYLQKLGLTRRDCYITQLEETRANRMRRVNGEITNPDPAYGQNYVDCVERFRVFELNPNGWIGWGWSPWMESFIGISLCHLMRLGFTEWRPIVEWHAGNLFLRSGDAWPYKAVDNYDNWFKRYWSQHTTPTNIAEAAAILPEITWKTLTPYEGNGLDIYNLHPDDELMPIYPVLGNPAGARMGHPSRAQHAYHWAEGLAQLGIPKARALANKLYASINARDGLGWDIKNALVNQA